MIHLRHFFVILGAFISNTALAAGTPPAVLNRGELAKVFLGLLLVVLLILFLSWLVKRLNVVQLSSSKGFELTASMMLGTKEKILLLKVGTRYLLVGVGASAVNTLYDFGEELPAGFSMENKSSFADLLKSTIRKS